MLSKAQRPDGANVEPKLRTGKSDVRSFSKIANTKQTKFWGRT
jgi:hypothetical protein